MINIRELTETFSVSNLKWNRLPSWNPPLPPSLSWNGCWIGLLKVLMHTMSLLLLSLYGPSQQNNSSSPPMKQQKWVHTISFTERIILILKKNSFCYTGEILVHVSTAAMCLTDSSQEPLLHLSNINLVLLFMLIMITKLNIWLNIWQLFLP